MEVEVKPNVCSLAQDEIRLLRFYQDNQDNLIGEIKTFQLSKSPSFFTASYVWGDKVYSERSLNLEDDGGKVPILENLEPFLDMVTRHKDFLHSQWWWIDSLCINQDDIQERNAQVAIMEQIYKKAKRVIVWLGDEREENNDCTGAIRFLRFLYNERASLETEQSTREDMRKPEYRRMWEAVGRLLTRRWFRRVWTLQEFLLSREAKFYCGTTSMSRSIFKSAMYSVWLCNGHDDQIMPKLVFDAAWNRRRIHQWYSKLNELPLIATLAYVSEHMATVDADRVYSIRGLVAERGRNVIGAPDYNIPVETLYATLVKAFWDEYQILDILCFTHIFNKLSGKEAQKRADSTLPSWAPDWRTQIPSSPVPLMASQPARTEIGNFAPTTKVMHSVEYNTVAGLPKDGMEISFSDNLKELRCSCVILDVIDGLAGLAECETRCASVECEKNGHPFIQSTSEQNVLESAQDGDGSSSVTLALTGSIAFSLVLNREDKYLSHAAPDKFITEFQALCLSCMEKEADLDPLFSTWFQQNRSLLVHGRPLIDNIRSALPESPSQTAHLVNAVDGLDTSGFKEDNILARFYDTVMKMSRRLMTTTRGLLGMAPCRARKGDVIAVLFGCSIPLVLREVEETGKYEVIGESYVHGYMNGEIAAELDTAGGTRKFETVTLV